MDIYGSEEFVGACKAVVRAMDGVKARTLVGTWEV